MSMESLKLKNGCVAVKVSCSLTGVSTKRKALGTEREGLLGQRVTTHTEVAKTVKNKPVAERLEALKKRAYNAPANYAEQTALGWICTAEAERELRAELSNIREEIEVIHAEQSDHRLSVRLGSLPVSVDLDPESLGNVYRDVEDALNELREIVLTDDDARLRGWKRAHGNLAAFLPELNAQAVIAGVTSALEARTAIKARVKAGESLESAARAEESKLADLDSALGWCVRAIDVTVQEMAAKLDKASSD